MNKDEVLNMPAGREMDVLIAKEVFGNVKNSWDWVFTLPSYSTDNSAAYDLEAEIFEKGFAVEYCNSLIYIINKEQNLRVVGDWVQYYYISHATAHEKCRAALLAVVPVNIDGV